MYIGHRNGRSTSVYDPILLQDKLLKIKIGNTFGTKQIDSNNNMLKGTYFFKEALNDRLREYSKQEAENARYSYQKKKLKVVKGKTNAYRERLMQRDKPEDRSLMELKSNKVNVSVVGTKLL